MFQITFISIVSEKEILYLNGKVYFFSSVAVSTNIKIERFLFSFQLKEILI
jgi:hypothetical protein